MGTKYVPPSKREGARPGAFSEQKRGRLYIE